MTIVYQKLDKVRKPRVHITYDVETENGSVKKELPFVVGVMGNFSGSNKKNHKSLKERKFVQIDGDNFDQVMAKVNPEVDIKVPNTLANDGTDLAVHLQFQSMEDFEPARIAQQVEPLKKLLETRQQLRELLNKADLSTELEAMLENLLQDNAQLRKLAKELSQHPSEEK